VHPIAVNPTAADTSPASAGLVCEAAREVLSELDLVKVT
jgi:hypothetical protein